MKRKRYSLNMINRNKRLFYIIQLLPNELNAVVHFLDTFEYVKISYHAINGWSKEITLKQALTHLKYELHTRNRNTLYNR